MNERIKSRTFEILEKASPGDILSRVFDVFIMALISLNVVAVILETVGSLASQYMRLFRSFEVFSITVFTIEYLLRIWTCNVDDRFKGSIKGRIRFALTPLALVDLMAILPFYIPMVIRLDLRFIRVVRLVRLFRMFKVGRYSESMRILGNVLRQKKEELAIVLFVGSILLIVASSLMYLAENAAQPQVFSSIPAAMWWGVATLTTVGYGDIYPVTSIGKLLGTTIAVLGIGMFALPAGILGSGFLEEVQRRRGNPRVCPHCGKDIDGMS